MRNNKFRIFKELCRDFVFAECAIPTTTVYRLVMDELPPILGSHNEATRKVFGKQGIRIYFANYLSRKIHYLRIRKGFRFQFQQTKSSFNKASGNSELNTKFSVKTIGWFNFILCWFGNNL